MNSEYQKAYWKANKERLMQRRRERAKEISEYQKGYRKKNAVRIRETHKAWLEKNPDKKAGYDREYRRRHPEKAKEKAWRDVRKRQTLKLNSFVESVDRQIVFSLHRGICGICDKPIAKGKKFHLDHIVPLSKGGEHSYENTQPAHTTCNLKKGAQEVKEIQRERTAEQAAKSRDSDGWRVARPGTRRNRRTRRS